jgi:hypothetical protein
MIDERILPPRGIEVLQCMEKARLEAFDGWTLAGGTGLALQLGHRISEDFDFFRTGGFLPPRMHEALRSVGAYETALEDSSSLVVLLDQVKLSFFQVQDRFLYPAQPWRFARIAAPEEIALMKLAAIGGRGARKDFIDLWFLVRDRRTALAEALAEMPSKYGADRVNRLHLLKSLTYFEDAEREPMPKMLVPFDWAECKAFFQGSVRELAAVDRGKPLAKPSGR